MQRSSDEVRSETATGKGVFMDDLTIATTHTVQTRWILGGLETLIKLARMKFNAKKSRRVVLKNE